VFAAIAATMRMLNLIIHWSMQREAEPAQERGTRVDAPAPIPSVEPAQQPA